MRRTTSGVRVDHQPGATGDARQQPGPARRRLYLSVTVKFVVAQVFAIGWLGVSVLLSLPWVRELAAAITTVPAFLVVCLVAYLPGWLVAFLAVSLVLDRQPPLRRSHPTIPVTVLVAARNEADRIQGAISYHRPPGLLETRRGPGRRQRLHRRHPGRGRGVRRRHRPAGALHRRATSRQEPRPQHRSGGGRN